jgi:hypothetical protein
MNFDLRFPIGLMFSFYGFLLVIYGIATGESPIYQRSLGLNINLIWGGAMFVFGLCAFVLAMRSRTAQPDRSAS